LQQTLVNILPVAETQYVGYVWKTKVHYRSHKSPPLVLDPNHTHVVHSVKSYVICKKHFCVVLPSNFKPSGLIILVCPIIFYTLFLSLNACSTSFRYCHPCLAYRQSKRNLNLSSVTILHQYLYILTWFKCKNYHPIFLPNRKQVKST